MSDWSPACEGCICTPCWRPASRHADCTGWACVGSSVAIRKAPASTECMWSSWRWNSFSVKVSPGPNGECKPSQGCACLAACTQWQCTVSKRQLRPCDIKQSWPVAPCSKGSADSGNRRLSHMAPSSKLHAADQEHGSLLRGRHLRGGLAAGESSLSRGCKTQVGPAQRQARPKGPSAGLAARVGWAGPAEHLLTRP